MPTYTSRIQMLLKQSTETQNSKLRWPIVANKQQQSLAWNTRFSLTMCITDTLISKILMKACRKTI
jgi:hypothetical protein